MLNDFFDYPGLVLTKAEEGDYTGIIELVRHCFADAEKVNGEAYTNLDDIKLRLAQGYELYAVKDGNNIIASVLVLPEDDEFDNALYFGRLCVTEVWRRRGLAPTLVKALIAHARDLGRELVVINFLKSTLGCKATTKNLALCSKTRSGTGRTLKSSLCS